MTLLKRIKDFWKNIQTQKSGKYLDTLDRGDTAIYGTSTYFDNSDTIARTTACETPDNPDNDSCIDGSGSSGSNE